MLGRLRSPVVLVPGVLLALVTGATTPALAGPEPEARLLPVTCTDGLGTAPVELVAADGSASTFATRVSSPTAGEVFRDEGTVVPAGQSVVLDVPDLFYGKDYRLEVSVGDTRVLVENFAVGCVPTAPYSRPTWDVVGTCDRSSVHTVRNTPVPGAEDLLEPVRFVVLLPGVEKYLEVVLPDGDGDPYAASVTVPWPEDDGVGSSADPQVTVTADGVSLDPSSYALPGCVEPTPVVQPVPNTGR